MPVRARSAGPSRRCGDDARARNTASMRRALRGISTVLIVAGVLLLADAGLTLAWQEPVSALLARIEQDRLAGRLEEIEQAPPTAVQRRALAALPSQRRRVAFLAREARRGAQEGEPIGRIEIPRIGADFVVVQGTDAATLRKGPGHYPDTTFPGLRARSRSPGTARRMARRSAVSTTCARRPDRPHDALRPLHVRRAARRDRPAERAVGDARRRLRPARAVGLPPALQRRASGSSCSRGCAGGARGRPCRRLAQRLSHPGGRTSEFAGGCSRGLHGAPIARSQRRAQRSSADAGPRVVPSGASGNVVARIPWTTRPTQ